MANIKVWKRYEDKSVTTSVEDALLAQAGAKSMLDKSLAEGGVFGRRAHAWCMPYLPGWVFLSGCCCSCCSHIAKAREEYHERTAFLQYAALRTAFIQSFNRKSEMQGNESHRLEGDFDFSEYSVKVLADKLGEIVEITPGNWVVIWFIFICFLAVDFGDIVFGAHTFGVLAAAVLTCYVCCFVVVVASKKARSIRTQLIHPLHFGVENPKRAAALRIRTVVNAFHFTGGYHSKEGGPASLSQPLLRDSIGASERKHETKLSLGDLVLQVPGSSGDGGLSGGNGRSGGVGGNVKKFRRRQSAFATLSQPASDLAANSPTRRGGRRGSVMRATRMAEVGIVHSSVGKHDHQPLYRYFIDGTPKPDPDEHTCCCSSHRPTHHQNLFWCGRHGVEMYFGYVRTQMVLIALYAGTFVVIFGGAVISFFDGGDREEDGGGGSDHGGRGNHSKSSSFGGNGVDGGGGGGSGDSGGGGVLRMPSGPTPWTVLGPVLVLFVSALPLLFIFVELSALIPLLIRITTTEEMINGSCVLQTLRIMKSRRALRALHNISCFLSNVDKLADRCREQALQSSTFLMLTAAEQDAVMQDAQLITYPSGMRLIQKGQVNEHLYIITEGFADVILSDENDPELKTVRLGPGKEFGEISMLNGVPCNASIVVPEDVPRMIAFVLNRQGFERHLRGKNENRELIVSGLGNQTRPDNRRTKSQDLGIAKFGPEMMSGASPTNIHEKKGAAATAAANDADDEEAGYSTARPQSQHSSAGLFLNKGRKKSVLHFTASFQAVTGHPVTDDDDDDASGPAGNGAGGERTAISVHADLKESKREKGARQATPPKPSPRLSSSTPTPASGPPSASSSRAGTPAHSAQSGGGRRRRGKREPSLAEVLQRTRSVETLAQQRKIALTDLFAAIDKSGDGSVDEDELKEFLSGLFPHSSENKAMQDKQIQLMVGSLDADGDGDVSLAEFIQMMEVRAPLFFAFACLFSRVCPACVAARSTCTCLLGDTLP